MTAFLPVGINALVKTFWRHILKVNVLQIDNAIFKKWSWWSNWIDVAVFDYRSTPFLLQMRVDRFNRKSFNAIRMTGTFAQSTCREIGDLTPMQAE